MKRGPEEPPIIAFDRYRREAENSSEGRARLNRSAPRPFRAWRDKAAFALALVVLLLLARWVAGLLGLA
ncbi:hypothetical protein [Methylobacterium sp. WL9]|uniref:hypothetical protein n=1 Tax=Methylobacterium sp. WL9 TaxID=2603898 RepID=UPI0011C7F3B4|nr:hypothetical protein [Methylobacterium sp. WL9]TXN21290.1 hypothetical protein FV217_14945 [Methylobacterium sp. WL9]